MELPALLISVASLFALANASTSQSRHQKRITNDLGQVYAYGTNVSGIPVFVKDSIAYIGNLSETTSSEAYVSFTQDEDAHLIATPINSDSSVYWKASYLAINTTAGAQDSAILTDASDSAGLTTTGFLLYGSQIAWLSDAGVLEISWYIMPTDTKSVWSLNWMADGNPYSIVGANVVVLKTKPAQ